MTNRERSLPSSLTRLLDATSYSDGGRPLAARAGPPADRRSKHAALEATVLRGFVYAVAGFVWLTVVGLFVRHLAH